MKLASITLPKTAVRISWLLRQVDVRYGTFARLLSKLDPKFPIDYSKGSHSAYYALLKYLDTQFPTFDPVFEQPDDEDDWDCLYEMEEFGIPVQFYGRDYDMREGDAAHAAFAAVEWFCAYDRQHGHWSAEIEHWAALCKIGGIKHFEKIPHKPDAIKLGRGWTWAGVWAGLPDLVRYAQSETGMWFLDHSDLDVMESGGFYPRWSVGEVRAIASEWKRAKPVWERIKALADTIDADREQYVPLVLRVLSGDLEAREMVTIRKPTKPRVKKPVVRTRANMTLVEVFCGQA